MQRTNKAGWRTIGARKIYFKSAWENNYACYLQFLLEHRKIHSWQYEPLDFWFLEIKRGVRSYKPDFFVLPVQGDGYWVEVKGHYDAKSLTKIKRFRKYYPKEILKLVDKKWFEKYGKVYCFLPGWEPEGSPKCLKRTLSQS